MWQQIEWWRGGHLRIPEQIRVHLGHQLCAVRLGQVGVALDHAQRAMSENLGELTYRGAGFEEKRSCAVPQIMEAEIPDPGAGKRISPGFLDVDGMRRVSAGKEQIVIVLGFFDAFRGDRECRSCEGYSPPVPVFGVMKNEALLVDFYLVAL